MRYKSKIVIVMYILLLLAVVGCGNNNHADMEMGFNDSMNPIEADLSIVPEQIKVNEKIAIEVVVTQQNMKISDADKVIIEIAPPDKESKHIEIPASHVGEGKYVVETSLKQVGTYRITSHVTVGAMHAMPSKEIIIVE
ncbi:nitrogen fixation protein FixH [Paenibacillus sp. DS2015]|uniref:FixH family protein n=1 Tax=Paenibacillus sp. DS2015 TaxID=3373917 RepID=UPI003D2575DF